MSRRNQILKILAPAVGNGPEVEMAAAYRVLESNPPFITLRKLLSCPTHSVALLAARCVLLSGNAQLAEEHHPIVRRAQIVESSKVNWASSTTLWAGLATAILGLFFAMDLGNEWQHLPVPALILLYGILVLGIWRLAGKVKRDRETRTALTYVRGAAKPSAAWSLAAINSLFPLARDRASHLRADAIAALTPVIPQLRAEDGELLTDWTLQSMIALAEARDDQQVPSEFRLKLIGALGLLGVPDAIPALERIESDTREYDSLRVAARSAIGLIQERLRRQQDSDKLLRPADISETDSLLRPAEDTSSNVETLLHIPDQ